MPLMPPAADWWRRAVAWLGRQRADDGATIPEPLWTRVWQRYPFLHSLSTAEAQRLRDLAAGFLRHKTFHGGQDLTVSDDMALGVAVQACLPLLHWGPQALSWYDDFVGIVIHPDEVLARREVVDEAGVVHQVQQALAGEAMAGGPVMLAWSHVAAAASQAQAGHNLVIHEFAHKLDLRHKALGAEANGCPRLPPGFMGRPAAAAQALWRQTLHEAHRQHQQAVAMSERFGAPPPWLDAYGASSVAEFFAVACEAYFVNRPRLAQEWPAVCDLLQAFFQPQGARFNA
jgi:MtfA peptidase